MQINRSRNKVVGSPEPKAESADRTSCSVDLFDDSGEDIFSEFDNASSTPSRSTSEKSGSCAGSRTASMENSLSSRDATLVDDVDESADLDKSVELDKSTELDKTVVEAPPNEWLPDDSFSEAMLKAFPFQSSPVSQIKSRVQSIKKASLKPSLLYTENGVLPSRSETAEDILKSMAPQYSDLRPSKASTLTIVQQELVPFSELCFKEPCSVDKEASPVGEQKLTVVSPAEETSILTDQQLIQAGEEAEMLLLLENEDDWLLSELDQCNKIGGKAVETADPVITAEGCQVKTEEEEVLEGGFKTANGGDILVSQVALRKASALFADIDKIELSNDNSEGFSLAREKEVAVSQVAQQITEEILADDCEPESSADGFRTASGRNIIVSQEALEKAKKILDEVDDAEEALSQPMKRKFESLSEDAENPCEAVKTVGDEVAPKKIKSSSIDAPEDEVTLDDLCAEIENMEYSGFSTASGKKVSISDESLKKVAGMFDDATCAEKEILEIASKRNTLKAAVDEGVSTPSGKKDTVSERSLAETMKEKSFEADLACLESVPMEGSDRIPDDVGFATASGKRVNVSESALEKARSYFEDGNSEEDLLELAAKLKDRSKHSPGRDATPVSFSTASGRKVTVSNDALKKAKQLFSDEKAGEDLLELAEKHRKRRSGTSEPAALQNSLGEHTAPVGFCTASGNQVPVSADALLKAKQLFADEDHEEDVAELAAKTRDRRKNLPRADPIGFSTANGKKVSVSNEALMKAKKLFADENAEDLLELAAKTRNRRRSSPSADADPVGFSTANGKKVSVSKEALMKAKKLFADDNAEDLAGPAAGTRNQMAFTNLPGEDTAPVGFATANGKSIVISNDALMRARQLFADVNSEEDLYEIASRIKSCQASLRSSQASPKKAQMSEHDLDSRSAQESIKNERNVEDTDLEGDIRASQRKLVVGKGLKVENSPIVDQEVGFTTDSLKAAHTIFKNVGDKGESSDKTGRQNMSPTVGGNSECRQRKRKSRLCEKGFKVPFPVKQIANPAEDAISAKKLTCLADAVGSPIRILEESNVDRKVPNRFSLSDGLVRTDENVIKPNFEEDNSEEKVKSQTEKTLSFKSHSPEQACVNPSDKTLSQEILESTAAFLADESENFSAFSAPVLMEPVTSDPDPGDRMNAPEPVTAFPEDCSPIAAPGSPILGERANSSQRKSRRKSTRKATGRLSLSTSLAAKDWPKTESVANVSLPVPLKVECVAPQEWEDDEMLTKLEIDDVISEASRIKEEEEQLGCGRVLRPEVSEARKRAAEEQEKIVKAGIAAKKGPKIAKGSLFAKKTASPKNQRSWKAFLGAEKPGTANRDEVNTAIMGTESE